MILAIDAYYRDSFAKFVCIEFATWQDTAAKEVYTLNLSGVPEYIPGEFYKRELPGTLEILKKVELAAVTCIVVDGYVTLNEEGKAGLGLRLYRSLEEQVPVIGVAKTSFLSNTKTVREVYRGISSKPLYITSVGIGVDTAAQRIKEMAGANRIPTLLKELDRLTKE